MTVTGIVVQARAGSSRLPGKVLMPLAGRTVLAHVIERCLAVEGVDVVCCAVPDGDADDAVAREAVRCGARVFRGSEADVLDRHAVETTDVTAIGDADSQARVDAPQGIHQRGLGRGCSSVG